MYMFKGRGVQLFLYSLGGGPQPQTLKTPDIDIWRERERDRKTDRQTDRQTHPSLTKRKKSSKKTSCAQLVLARALSTWSMRHNYNRALWKPSHFFMPCQVHNCDCLFIFIVVYHVWTVETFLTKIMVWSIFSYWNVISHGWLRGVVVWSSYEYIWATELIELMTFCAWMACIMI